jgi:glucose/arabinose dehydrogenase
MSPRLYFAAAALAGVTAFVTAPETDPDEQAIRRHIESTYFDGVRMSDTAVAHRAFHPQMRAMYSVRDGALAERSIPDWLAAIAKGASNPPKPDAVRRTVVSVDVTGDAAVAKLRLDSPGSAITDFMSLLKVDGRWVIVGKIFHRETSASAGASVGAALMPGPGAGGVITGTGFGPNPRLPAPDTTASATRFSRVVAWPEGRTPVAPPGFTVSLFASGLQRPRWLHPLSNGDLLVAESANDGGANDTLNPPEVIAARWASGNRGHSANRITLLRDADRDGVPEHRWVLLWGLNRPVGMAYLDGWLYVANTNALVRYPYRLGDTLIQAPPRRVIELPGGGYNNHWTRNVVANSAGTRLYLTVGSGTNVDVEVADAKDPRRAAILELSPDGSGMRVFASGLRNPGGMDWVPGTDQLWTVVNERDGLGDDLVPDYLTQVRDGAFYGWPYSYFGRHEDPRQRGRRPDLVARAVAPDYAIGAHTASLGLAFYRGTGFPEPWRSGAFIGQHGSWNRSALAGYRVMFVPFASGKPSGPPREFLGGFYADSGKGKVYGRPLGVAVALDGSLLVADDPANRIWRVAYTGQRPAGAPDPAPKRLATVTGLARPESVRWDPEQRVWFVSNINGRERPRDGDGFISRLAPDGRIEALRFVDGAAKGVTLHDPKGLAITGDTLWVADAGAVRGFHRRTGAPVATIELDPVGALFPNDLAATPDGTLWLTDTGVRFDSAGNRIHSGPDRIYRIRGRRLTVALEGGALGQPNGIAWDPRGKRFLLGPVVGDSAVQEWKEGRRAPTPVARGIGRYDGIEVLPDGRTLVSAWNDSTVSEVVGSEVRPLIRGVPTAADIGVDPEAGVVAVPILTGDRVELWRLPGRGTSPPRP